MVVDLLFFIVKQVLLLSVVVAVDLVDLLEVELEAVAAVALVEQELLVVSLFVVRLLILCKLEQVDQVMEMALLLI